MHSSMVGWLVSLAGAADRPMKQRPDMHAIGSAIKWLVDCTWTYTQTGNRTALLHLLISLVYTRNNHSHAAQQIGLFVWNF